MTNGEDGGAGSAAVPPEPERSVWARPDGEASTSTEPAAAEAPAPLASAWSRPTEPLDKAVPPAPDWERPEVVGYRPVMHLPPQPFAPRPPVPAAVEPPRRSRVRWRAMLVVGVALAVLVPVVAFARTAVTPARALASSAAGSVGSPSPTVSRTPDVGERIEAAFDAQAKALLAGDLAGYTAAIEPANAELREVFTHRFGSLRALQVSRWEVQAGAMAQGVDNVWAMQVVIRYCFVTPDCVPVPMQVSTHWAVTPSEVWLRKYDNVDDDLVRPWDVSDLRAAVGRRVILATTAKYASRLPAMLAAADKAADVADRYAKWTKPPGRYLVLLAGPDEWAKWYSGEQSKWAAGYATRVSIDVADVVLNANRVTNSDTGYVLRHELAHVVTLIGGRGRTVSWWLVEGIAEYVRVVGGGTAFDGISDVRKFVRSGRWTGDVALSSPGDGAPVADVRGFYGIAYLTVRRLADRFGEAKMLDFFDAVVRQGENMDVVSTEVFGVDWESVAADCAQYVRSRV